MKRTIIGVITALVLAAWLFGSLRNTFRYEIEAVTGGVARLDRKEGLVVFCAREVDVNFAPNRPGRFICE